MSQIRRNHTPKGGWTFSTEEQAEAAILEALASEIDDSSGFAASLGLTPMMLAERRWHITPIHFDSLSRIELGDQDRSYFYVVAESFWATADEFNRYPKVEN